MNKYFVPPVITISVLIAIIGIVIIAKASMKDNEQISISVLSYNNEHRLDDEELNDSERKMLALLMSGIEMSDSEQVGDCSINSIYIKLLIDYLSTPGIDIDTKIASEVEDQITSLNKIMHIEKKSNFKRMSVDGREVAIFLSKKIYELCGLKLSYNMEGDIAQIAELSGDVIYLNDEPIKQTGFQLNSLLIIFGSILFLLSLCIFIAKKNQLFLKDEYYIKLVKKSMLNDV